MTISACITVKNRVELLRRGIESLEASGVDEIVVTDWHSTDTNYDWFGHKLIEIDGDFSIGRGKNEAAKHATKDIIFFLDADLLVSKLALKRVVEVVQGGGVYAPIMYMERQGWAEHSFGQVALSHTDWLTAEPWPEWQSYGGEDNIFIWQFQKQHRVVREKEPGLLHQFHDHNLREKYYTKPAGHDLDLWDKEHGFNKYSNAKK